MVEVKRQIFNSFSPIFQRMGYEALPSMWQFRKPFNGGFVAFILNVIVEDEQTNIELALGVRHHAVENYIQPFTTGLTVNQVDNFTLMLTMGQLQGASYRKYTIREDFELEEVIEQINVFVAYIGDSLLQDWTDLKKLDGFFNRDVYDESLLKNTFQRATRGLTIARFVGNEKYDSLKEKYHFMLYNNNFPGKHFNALSKLTTFLSNYNPN